MPTNIKVTATVRELKRKIEVRLDVIDQEKEYVSTLTYITQPFQVVDVLDAVVDALKTKLKEEGRMLEFRPVVSSNLNAVAYQGTTLFIRFNSGKTYSYNDVSHDEYLALINAPSVGKHFHTMGIKSRGVKVDG